MSASARILSVSSLAGRTGRGVRIAVIDSGVHAGHPHIGAIAGAAAFDDEGRVGDDSIDRLGHGTAIAAAIHEKAPDAELVIARVFDRSLAATGAALVSAIRWAADQRASLINLSLGTTNQNHVRDLAEAVRAATERGAALVAAAPTPEHRWLPGALDGVIAVSLDWTCDRNECRLVDEGGRIAIRASGFPRPIPGVPPERNLKGQSFAVANATGLLALVAQDADARSMHALVDCLTSIVVATGPESGQANT